MRGVTGYVFISYSRTDRAYVDELAAHLRSRGVQVWYDFAVESGDSFGERIQHAIDGCAAFLVVLSPASVNSAWVRREIARATRSGKSMHPLLRHACDVPIELDGVQHEDVTRGQLPSDRFVETLVRDLHAGPARPAPPLTASSPARRWQILVPALLVILLLLGGGVWLVTRDHSGQPDTLGPTTPPANSTEPVNPIGPPVTSAQPPQPLGSVSRRTPGCGESDSRVVWTPVRADVGCSSTATTLTRQVGWDDGFQQSHAELRMSMPGQDFPGTYTVSFTISGLSGPETDVNRGGCGGIKVHTTADNRTYDQINICADGLIQIQRLVGDASVGDQHDQVTPGPTQGTSPAYTVVVNVSPSSVQLTVGNGQGENKSVTSPAVGASTTYLSLMQSWRNVGGTVSFSDFTYSAAS
jgi:hypothetical protein